MIVKKLFNDLNNKIKININVFFEISVPGFEKIFSANATTKKEASRLAAYYFLCYIMGIEIEEQ